MKKRHRKATTIDPRRAYYDLFDIQSDRAAGFYGRNTQAMQMFKHMLGYGFVNRVFEKALLDGKEDGEELRARVRIAIETQIFTNLFAAVRVLAYGMVQECQLLMRSAFEALQYVRLLHFDESLYATFDTEPLRPVVVRKKLEEIGHDAVEVRRIYDEMSVAAHVGGAGKLDFNVKELEKFPKVVVGGYVEPSLQDSLLVDIVAMLHMYQGFCMGIAEEKIAEYFREIRAVTSEGPMNPERAKKVTEVMLRHQFTPK